MQTDFSQKEGQIWFDGVLVDWSDAKTHVLTQGLNYAGSVFEGIRAYNGIAFRLEEHIQRFHNSAKLMGFQIQYSIEELMTACEQSLKENNLSNAYIRPVAWLGAQKIALSSACKVHCAIASFSWDSYFDQDAISLQVSRWRKPGERFSQPQSKTAANYAIPALAKSEAERDGFSDALMLDEVGYLAEATASNIFIVQNGIVRTPAAKACLNGITRQEVIKICGRAGIPCEETSLTTKDLFEAEEVFVCGTAAEITPVCKMDSKSYKSGPVTEFLKREYSELANGKGKSEESTTVKYADLLSASKNEEVYDIATDPVVHEAWLRLRLAVERTAHANKPGLKVA